MTNATTSGGSSAPDPSAALLSPGTAATQPLPSARDVPGREPVIPGHISIAPRVLQRVGGAVVAESLAVDRRDVRVEARDDEGRLALRVATPVGIPVLSADVDAPEGGLLGTIRALQETVTQRVHEITGRAVSRVDVNVTGSRLEKNGRPR